MIEPETMSIGRIKIKVIKAKVVKVKITEVKVVKVKITEVKVVKVKVIKAKIIIKKIPGIMLKCKILPDTLSVVVKLISVFTISGN
ncbi:MULTISPECIES: hypothetical protein [unclassified Methanosarcina]|uniref:hypothetical protein n=1 Tax=unclassified Methanosarcina TaxID=2644672 RepID=UPI000B1A3999|nr:MULTISPECIES: hypothetical protein [unclassified Methanosarcina]